VVENKKDPKLEVYSDPTVAIRGAIRMPPFNGQKIEEPIQAKTRIGQEIDCLRQKIAEFESLELELIRAEIALQGETSGAPQLTPEQLKSAIKSRLGFFPQFLAPAAESPGLLSVLWQQSLDGCYDNPIPELLREKILLLLARYCASPYALVVRSCSLHAKGLEASDILQWIQLATPTPESDLEEITRTLAEAVHPLEAWPETGTALESALIRTAILLYLKPAQAESLIIELRRLISSERYEPLIQLLGYAKSFHVWLECHPEISYHSDPLVRNHILQVLRDEPRLASLFRNYYQEFGSDRHRMQVEEALRASEERYRELFENASDMVFTMNLQGALTSLNKAAERLTGYSRAEALQLDFVRLVAPECRDVARKITGVQENVATHEVEIITKEGGRVALEISTHVISRQGKPVGVQGIARDITERKKTEEALQQTKIKLEDWVRELEQRTREMTLLSEMGDMLRACLTTEEAYTVIVRVAQQIFPAQAGALYVITPSRNLVEAVAVWGDGSGIERVFSPDECWGLRRGRVHWVESSRFGLVCKHVSHPAPEGYLCVPMMAQSEALGVLYLAQPADGCLTEAKQRLAVTMAEHIAMALSNLRLHETLRSQSIRDPLTGLFNRRFMEESLALELRRAVRNQRPLGVIMLDLDRFKHFNDTYGHDAGDALLRELGTLLQTHIRGEDIACRYGGEEFTLIMPEGSAETTQQRSEELRAAIKRLEVLHRGQPLGRISMSFGVAIFPEHGRTAEALLQAADAALYQSKAAGGDKVTLAR
jgi:diguanylate cyclase (GGDEF)-like protein/PAS domain S-box-containing protein